MDFMRAKRSNSMSEGQFSVMSRLVAEGMGISPVGQARACSQAMPTGLRTNATSGAEACSQPFSSNIITHSIFPMRLFFSNSVFANMDYSKLDRDFNSSPDKDRI